MGLLGKMGLDDIPIYSSAETIAAISISIKASLFSGFFFKLIYFIVAFAYHLNKYWKFNMENKVKEKIALKAQSSAQLNWSKWPIVVYKYECIMH